MNDTEAPAPAAAPSSTTRRGLLLGAGLLATAAGVAVAWKLLPVGHTQAGAGEPFPGFWDLQWDAPAGTPLRMRSFQGKPLLINFWATWCPPCVEELPLINTFYREHQAHGWQVLGLAVDRPAAVQSFLAKMPLDFPVAVVGVTGGDLGGQLGNPSGSLPFSVALGADGHVLQRKLGRLRPDDLAAWAQLK